MRLGPPGGRGEWREGSAGSDSLRRGGGDAVSHPRSTGVPKTVNHRRPHASTSGQRRKPRLSTVWGQPPRKDRTPVEGAQEASPGQPWRRKMRPEVSDVERRAGRSRTLSLRQDVAMERNTAACSGQSQEFAIRNCIMTEFQRQVFRDSERF